MCWETKEPVERNKVPQETKRTKHKTQNCVLEVGSTKHPGPTWLAACCCCCCYVLLSAVRAAVLAGLVHLDAKYLLQYTYTTPSGPPPPFIVVHTPELVYCLVVSSCVIVLVIYK